MKSFGKYTTYIWSLITIILSVIIIFVSVWLSSVAFNFSVFSKTSSESYNLDLPDVLEIISTSLDSQSAPAYYPPYSEEILITDFRFEKVEEKDDTVLNKIYDFSSILAECLEPLFDISTTAGSLALRCSVWNVYSNTSENFSDTLFSVNIILRDYYDVFWNITASGTPDRILSVSRTAYQSGESLGSESFSEFDIYIEEYYKLAMENMSDVCKLFNSVSYLFGFSSQNYDMQYEDYNRYGYNVTIEEPTEDISGIFKYRLYFFKTGEEILITANQSYILGIERVN